MKKFFNRMSNWCKEDVVSLALTLCLLGFCPHSDQSRLILFLFLDLKLDPHFVQEMEQRESTDWAIKSPVCVLY